MAESEISPPATAPESSAVAPPEPAPVDLEEVAVCDHKRKLDEFATATEATTTAGADKEGEDEEAGDASAEAKRQKVEGDGNGEVGEDGQGERLGAPPDAEEVPKEDGIAVSADLESHATINGQDTMPDKLHAGEEFQNDGAVLSYQQEYASNVTTSRKIEVANNKVGVLIGKSGEIIRSLQMNSGAKIQITRDNEADPNSSTRSVEITGSVESINKAEQLIKDVIAEADAGGSPALVARGFGGAQSGAEQIEMQIPNEKVGLVIGKGGETIKSLQTRSGARIQLIPQHLPEGDVSKERTVRITGNRKQIEAAKSLVMAAINQTLRPEPRHGGYPQQGYGPQGTGGPASYWGPRPSPLGPAGHDYPQRGMYPPQSSQYPPQYGSYQQPPRGGPSWEQRYPPVEHAPPQGGGYDYYKQGGPAYGGHSSVAPGPGPAPTNYNYGSLPSYQQPGTAQQGYGQGYGGGQNYYGQQPVNSQPAYHSGYPSQQPTYGQQTYAPPRGPQGDPIYQGPQPAQQTYPYGTVPSQQAPYGASYSADGYQQSSAGYQQGGYTQGMQQPAPAYNQMPVGQPGGYQQYPAHQGYGDPAAASNTNYGYQAVPTDASGYTNNQPAAGYAGPPPAGQAGYVQQPGYAQPTSTTTGYDQGAPPVQPVYGSAQGSAPAATAVPANVPAAAYQKGISPQPGYTGQWQA